MAPNRGRGAPAALTSGVSAGTRATSECRASEAPTPRGNERRGIASLAMNMNASLQLTTCNLQLTAQNAACNLSVLACHLSQAHRERRAVHDAEDQRREPVV